MKKKIVVLSGAGISAESGIKTFRDHDGLWEGHDVMEVASYDGWLKNKKVVLDFYNARRRQLKEVLPNQAHVLLAELELEHEVTIITQNVDDLHERAGSTKIIHLHGQLLKVRGEHSPHESIDWYDDLELGQKSPRGEQLRPDIVWFGEAVPKLEEAILKVGEADVVIIVGTSMQVYPAAGLVTVARPSAEIFYIDKNPNINHDLMRLSKLKVLKSGASEGMKEVLKMLMK
ncbi:MAG: NAD-dependent deacylase [Saprospiraceae bacterium]|nr:NAD-dependent deacylase [Saprospiraceae bacterium]